MRRIGILNKFIVVLDTLKIYHLGPDVWISLKFGLKYWPTPKISCQVHCITPQGGTKQRKKISKSLGKYSKRKKFDPASYWLRTLAIYRVFCNLDLCQSPGVIVKGFDIFLYAGVTAWISCKKHVLHSFFLLEKVITDKVMIFHLATRKEINCRTHGGGSMDTTNHLGFSKDNSWVKLGKLWEGF